MSVKIGRNDPCPCGSGRKYKQCHGRAANDAHGLAGDADRAIERTVQWLTDHRRKPFRAGLDELVERFVLDAAPSGPPTLDGDALEQLQINLTEWLIADGTLVVKGRTTRTVDDVLGADGPALSDAQRLRIEQLRAQPLWLYTVTAVRPGVGLTMCDAIETAAEPIDVVEDLGSQAMKTGTLIGARVLELDGRRELSGSMYVFAPLAAARVIDAVRSAARLVGPDGERLAAGAEIVRQWVRQFTAPRRLPQIMDAASGEPMLLITDHYRVLDAAALAAALAGCGDVDGDAQQGWRREFTGSDGLVRSSVVVNPGKQPDRIEVFYRTQRQADEGRPWFEGVAGAAVAHLTREIADPQGVLAHAAPGKVREAPAAPADTLPPEVMAQAVEQIMRKHYANWCDEPIPALDGRTPRQAIATTAGLERVKGLLRSYEEGESRQSAAQGRPAFSYQFLWDALGIAR